jgi:hypothetical protein
MSPSAAFFAQKHIAKGTLLLAVCYGTVEILIVYIAYRVLEAAEDATACTLRIHYHCARGSAVPNTKLPVAVLSCNLLLRRAVAG